MKCLSQYNFNSCIRKNDGTYQIFDAILWLIPEDKGDQKLLEDLKKKNLFLPIHADPLNWPGYAVLQTTK